ncbi:hypothetical protein [Saliphagus infecundisoli]|uniref:Uncharacterized protein n=1 Tax=Saliphagus infecundisoli TaxID=1849069 RepID=A0ABD5QFK3_9EURY|nr:hypothetical protein [Saliphagus infecundisoli]
MERTRPVLKVIVGVNVLFLVLLAFSAPYLEPGSGSYVVAVITAGLCLVMLTISAVITYFEWDVFGQF